MFRSTFVDPFRPQTLEAIALIISGGSAHGYDPATGFLRYRAGWEIENFLKGLQIDFIVGGRSRFPALKEKLTELNQDPRTRHLLLECIKASVHPIDYVHDRDRLDEIVRYVNGYLRFEGLEVRVDQSAVEVVKLRNIVASEMMSAHTKALDLDTVHRDFERARESVATDPEDAITAACSMLESILRSIIVALGEELPAKRDLGSLYKVVREKLQLSPERSNISEEIAGDVKAVLGGLASCVSGIAALRTHAGDAHGRESGHARVDSRIALLAVNAASSLGLFLIETWQMRYPTTPLKSINITHQAGPVSEIA